MTTSELIAILSESLAKYGDLEVQIESSHSEYSPNPIRYAKAYRNRHDGSKVEFLLASDDESDGYRDALASESQREAAGLADEKPDRQAENAEVRHGATDSETN
jgi:hypothetical protein